MPEILHAPVPGGELAVARWAAAGGGATVVAAHGITGSQVFWTLVGERLADAGVTLLAPDLRGRGNSAQLAASSSITRHADDLAAILDHAGVERTVVVGHSMGAFVASSTAVRHPERVARLLLVDGGPPLTAPLPADVDVEAVLRQVIGPSLDRLRRTFASPEDYRAFWHAHPAMAAAPDELVDAYADYDLREEADGWHARVRESAALADARDTLLDADVLTAFARATCPTLLLYAERGMLDGPEGLYRPAAVEDLVARHPHLEARLVPDTNHFSIGMSHHGADAVAAAIIELLARTGQPAVEPTSG